jgi:hypothetical protein
MLKLLLLVSLFASAQSRVIQKPDESGAKYCSNVDDVAKEAVAYHLTGAASTNLPLTCALKMKWKYFNPNNEGRTPEGGEKKPDYTWFTPGKDSYQINKIRKVEDGYEIDVEFTIQGKKINSTYTYEPWDLYQKKLGVCGIVYNYNKPWIFRKDCQK